MMRALLLARTGVPVTVLEAHKDFDGEFRGDTFASFDAGGSRRDWPVGVRMFFKIPALKNIPARVLGFGIRPAHVED
jgi:hypothetical protein